ncbi:MAG: hypothetical protein RLZZ153_899 [Pseudomonadota bacterium]|jgi:hypothetical protein
MEMLTNFYRSARLFAAKRRFFGRAVLPDGARPLRQGGVFWRPTTFLPGCVAACGGTSVFPTSKLFDRAAGV